VPLRNSPKCANINPKPNPRPKPKAKKYPANSPGTKSYSIFGNIENTGLIELPMGTTLWKVISKNSQYRPKY
jgi:hypothetical protein